MKKIIALLSFSCQALLSTAQSAPLPPAEFEKKIETVKPQLLDVRTPGEYQSSHIKNSLQANWMDTKQFADRVQYLDKTKPVFVYCASGGRSAAAAKWLHDNGFTDVQDLKGGLSAWKVEGLPVEAVNAEKQMKLDDYKHSIGSTGVVLVDVGAEWCPPCKKMEPVLDMLKNDRSLSYGFVKVDGGIDIDIMKAMKVEAIPTFIVYKNGKEVWRKQGIVEIDELKKQLN